MKKINKLLTCSLLFFSVIGCKKITPAEEITIVDNASTEKVKAWFDKLPPKKETNDLTASPFINGLPAGKPDWEKLRYNPQDKAYTIPVSIAAHGQTANASAYRYLVVNENDKGDITGGNYVMVLTDKTKPNAITQDDINYGMLSLRSVPGNFNGAVLQYDMSDQPLSAAHYEKGEPVRTKADKFSGKPVTVNNNMPLPDCGGEQTCIDWYWQTYVNGVLVYEEYLFTTCSCYSNGGGGGGGQGGGGGGCTMSQSQAIQALNNVTYTTQNFASFQEGAQYVQNGIIRKPKDSHWQFLTLGLSPGFNPQYSANFTGIIYKQVPADPWKWESFAYQNTTQTGGAIPQCFDVYISPNVSTAIIENGLRANAVLSCAVIVKINCMVGIQAASYPVNALQQNFDASLDY